MIKTKRGWLALGAVLCMALIKISAVHSHEDPPIAIMQGGDFPERLQRIQWWAPYVMQPAIRQRASFKIAVESMRSRGLTAAEITSQLFGGREMAFPYAAHPELNASGTVRTLTILIDFKDHRAGVELPGMTPQTISQNIYGPGTASAQKYAPYESVNAYYKRASEGKVDIQGDVLGWYHFPKNKGEYKPGANKNPELQAQDENRAIFKMVTEALDSYAADHDFEQYDGNHDGSIDLVTIIYCGPDEGWGSFWWAYRWEFFIPEAAQKKYNGKRLKQFVFEYARRRPAPDDKDFDPSTLMHEMGHAFGLADYYHYPNLPGPSGGVGKLDMMDANWGNHNAFSRWLLDWIDVRSVSSAPAKCQLVASGSSMRGDKAIAVFPEIQAQTSPNQEMFIVENRFPVGNDGNPPVGDTPIPGPPGSGLLIWHVDGSPNSANASFALDNSTTPTKLIRLMRANSNLDFAGADQADAGTYFTALAEFSPSSTPNSNTNSNQPSGVAVRNISAPAEVMSAEIGVLPAQGAFPAPGGDQNILTITKDLESAISRPTARTSEIVSLENIEGLMREFQAATPQTLKSLWGKYKDAYKKTPESRETSVILQLLLAQWAGKDGLGAVDALLELPEGAFRQEAFPRVMEAWAANEPTGAADWYFDPQRESVRGSNSLVAGGLFSRQVFTSAAMNDLNATVNKIDSLKHVSEIMAAVDGIKETAPKIGLSVATVAERLKSATVRQKTIQAISQFQEVMKSLETEIKSPNDLDSVRRAFESQGRLFKHE